MKKKNLNCSNNTFFQSTLVLVCLIIFFAGCGSTSKIIINSDPDEAFIKINNENIGTIPTAYEFDFDKSAFYRITTTKEGYYEYSFSVNEESPKIESGEILIALQEDAAWKVTSMCEATNKWIRVQVREDLKQKDAWIKLVDAITSVYDNLEEIDSDAGYIRSVRKRRQYSGPEGKYYIRTQLILSTSSRSPFVFKMKIVSETSLEKDKDKNWDPYDRVFKVDAQLFEELQARLGIK